MIFLLIVNPFVLTTGFDTVRLIATVLLTAALLRVRPSKKLEKKKAYSIVASIGIASYSIYIWHQVIIAFYRYIVDASPSAIALLFCMILTAAVSYASYCWVEIKFALLKNKIVVILSLMLCACTTIFSLYLYTHAGVIRDVPELDVYADMYIVECTQNTAIGYTTWIEHLQTIIEPKFWWWGIRLRGIG